MEKFSKFIEEDNYDSETFKSGLKCVANDRSVGSVVKIQINFATLLQTTRMSIIDTV